MFFGSIIQADFNHFQACVKGAANGAKKKYKIIGSLGLIG